MTESRLCSVSVPVIRSGASRFRYLGSPSSTLLRTGTEDLPRYGTLEYRAWNCRTSAAGTGHRRVAELPSQLLPAWDGFGLEIGVNAFTDYSRWISHFGPDSRAEFQPIDSPT